MRARFLSTLGVNQERILQESFGESKRSTDFRPPETRPGRDRRVYSLGKVLSGLRRKHAAGSGGTKRRADSVWLPPRPMRHVRYSSSERHRSNGR